MLFEPVFERFVERAPACVMLRATLEHLFTDAVLDDLFARTAQIQYTRTLTFSAVSALLLRVVLRCKPSLRAAYRDQGSVPATLKAVYEKLQHIEPAVCQAVVAETAQRAAAVLDCWPGVRNPDPVPGLRLRVVDGNYLAGTEHRLAPLRGCGAAALPGMSIVLRDDRSGLVPRLLCREDAYTNERSLVADILSWVAADDLVVADRNFCTLDFLRGMSVRQAYFLVRHHQQLHLEPLGPRRRVGRTETGWVYEQPVRLGSPEEGLTCRCVIVALDQPTQDGETEIVLLSNVPAERADAIVLAEVYRRRWRVEHTFQELTDLLRCEVDTLGYPQAALFGFSLAVAAYNVLAILKGALASVQGRERVETELSSYALTEQVASTYEGMRIALPEACWTRFRHMTAAEFAAWLTTVAQRMPWARYRKSKRAPKKPSTIQRTQRGAHRSTARVLQNRHKR